jgi:S-adenosylmethionine:tRNA ribosyltransferase-isomerase
MVKISEYTYELPEKSIALEPPKVRGASKLLVLDRSSGATHHRKYQDLIDYLEPGDVLVLNDTRVIKARLLATNADGKKRELLLLEDHHNTDFNSRKALYRGKVREGETLDVSGNKITIDTIFDNGTVQVSASQNLLEIAERTGSVPLPPYLHREATETDTERYQTVFARDPGSVAAPTASLNFTKELEQKLKQKGIHIAYLTLHVGLGTFLPIRSDDIEQHTMHSEYFEIPPETISLIRNARLNRCKIVALGTTVSRTLEYAADKVLGQNASMEPKTISGEADIFIYPGYTFKLVDALLTNFHAPKSTVLMMAAAFAGWPQLKNAYEQAIDHDYKLLSYGDSMLITAG